MEILQLEPKKRLKDNISLRTSNTFRSGITIYNDRQALNVQPWAFKHVLQGFKEWKTTI